MRLHSRLVARDSLFWDSRINLRRRIIDVGANMREWYAIYEDDASRNPVLVVIDELKPPDYGGFQEAASSRSVKGRKIFGMYILDKSTEQTDVILYCGPIRSYLFTIAYLGPRTKKLW